MQYARVIYAHVCRSPEIIERVYATENWRDVYDGHQN